MGLQIPLRIGIPYGLGGGVDIAVPLPPVNTVAPAITGTPAVDSTLSVSNGTWDNVPTSYTYQWFRAITSGGSIVTSGGLFTGVPISGATANTYLLDAADETQKLYVEVTATNAGGSAMKQSNATDAITSGAWSPANLGANLLAWYKADTGVYSDLGLTPTVADDPVRQWNDQSGNGLHMTEATLGNRPIHRFTGLAGGKALQFTAAANKKLATAVAAVSLGGTVYSAFLVMLIPNTTPANGRVLAYHANGDANDFGAVTSGIALLTPASTPTVGGYRNGALGSFAVTASAAKRIGAIFDGTNHTVYVDNVAKTPSASSGTFGATGQIVVGNTIATGSPSDCTIAEIVVTKSAIGAPDRLSLDDYFKARYGLV